MWVAGKESVVAGSCEVPKGSIAKSISGRRTKQANVRRRSSSNGALEADVGSRRLLARMRKCNRQTASDVGARHLVAASLRHIDPTSRLRRQFYYPGPAFWRARTYASGFRLKTEGGVLGSNWPPLRKSGVLCVATTAREQKADGSGEEQGDEYHIEPSAAHPQSFHLPHHVYRAPRCLD